MTGWILSGVLLVGACTMASAQEAKRPSAPPLPPLPPTGLPRVASAPPRAPVVAPSATVPVQVVPQPFPTQPFPTQAFPPPQPFPTQAFPPAAVVAGTPASAGPLTALKFDSERKDYSSKPGEMQAPFTFYLTNTSSSEVSITAVLQFSSTASRKN